MLTVGELLSGKGIDYPHITGSNITLRRAQRARSAQPEAIGLFAAEATRALRFGRIKLRHYRHLRTLDAGDA